MTDQRLINIGFGNSVVAGRVIAVVNPKSSPMKKLKDEARDQKKLVDVTEGRRTRSIIVMDSGHVILSSVQPETLTQRFSAASLTNPKLDEDPV
ncbi:MAG: DUF370 domain-containing protein [Proteobacteria bacterium]|nr:DUF370 domain-containing protein [Pseudomonadota bacterium]MBU1686756.1 DUF370 domain-containing protein [Pseudomonadota bacterium]